MASIWGVYGNRREDGYSHFPYQDLVYLYLFSYHGLSSDRVFHPRLLDEHKTLYPVRAEESAEIPLMIVADRVIFRTLLPTGISIVKLLFLVPIRLLLYGL